ncbi:uncharacterized protein LOC129723920 [Wyeomyia smithii]|uniref:uncharacterized protein LOC129723920 n=1 Tax=Wyeomyia smithii TaxID=174621 RepID=UPI002467E44D|nr:uncharacterized protein LOC129723920 [Wyeomyia smithii]
MNVLLLVVFCVASTVSAVPMTELAERTEEFRILFDNLHMEKDEFVDLTRALTTWELRLLNDASQQYIAEMWSIIEHRFDETREAIANATTEANANEDCLLGLVEEIVAERIRAADEISACAAFKINVKEGLADDFRNLGNTLQQISTAAAEYTLFTFAGHNSFINSAGHLDWLEHNYELQREFWETTALVEAQADLDELEVNRPALLAEFRECLSHIPVEMDEVDQDITDRMPGCMNN